MGRPLGHATLQCVVQILDFALAALALDGVADGACEQKGVDLALDEIILCAMRHRLRRELFVGGTADFVQTRQAVHAERCHRHLAEHFLDEARVARIVLDQTDSQRVGHDSPYDFGTSLTIVNQKFSMDWTTSTNCCSPRGFVT